MRIKKYNRNLVIKDIMKKVDLDILNSKLQAFFISCKMQLSIFNNMSSQDHNTSEYKNFIKEYSDSKKQYKKISRSKL